jgi:hypothetical protein
MILSNTGTMTNTGVMVILHAYLKNTGEDVNSKHLKLYYSIRAQYVTNGANLKKKKVALNSNMET